MPKDTHQKSALAVSIGQYSCAGHKPENQDFHGAVIPGGAALTLKGVALAIADGISTSPISREAAETSVKSLLTDYYCTPDAWTVKTAASRVIAATNSWLYAQNRRARISDLNLGRVSTLSALILKGRKAHLFHVGDSRIYRLSHEALEPLTQDHRIVLSSVEDYLGRAMGLDHEVEIDYRALDLSAGDVFVLTTDGVHEHMDAQFVAQSISRASTLDKAAEHIAKHALQRGSADNLTLQIVRVDSLPDDGGAALVQDLSHLPIPALPNDGTVIDGYRVLRQIHSNHRSHIYLAQDPAGNKVALKIPAVDVRDNPEYLRQFLMEEWIARRLNSPHVLHAAPPPIARTALYVVTEFVQGQTLRQWMTDHPVPDLQQVRDIIEQTTRGLRAFHRREMLHQDIRPENIMIDRNGTVKIIDFGSTRIAGVQEADPADDPVLGTLQYTAPEYFSGDHISARSDMFSLGVVAYEMLSGRLPYGTQVSKVRNRTDQRRLTYRPARDDKHPVPDWVEDALRRAVHPDPLKRFDALSEFAGALRAPGPGYRAGRHVPLAQRDPVRFWQSISGILALIIIVLMVKLFG